MLAVWVTSFHADYCKGAFGRRAFSHGVWRLLCDCRLFVCLFICFLFFCVRLRFEKNKRNRNTFKSQVLIVFFCLFCCLMALFFFCAGHDNYFNQSYPMVFERRMSSVFSALGIDLLVHNSAMGGNQCRPSNFCYEAQVGITTDNDFPLDYPPGVESEPERGSEIDWLGWEQSYNCGKDRGFFELIARVAYWHKSILHFSASGAFAPSNCNPSSVRSRN